MKGKKKKIIIAVVVFCGLLIFTAAKGTSAKSKVGYIDTNVLWSLIPEKALADTNLSKMRNEFVMYVNQKQMDLEKGILSFQKDSSGMSPLIKEQRLTELYKQQEDIKAFSERADEELMKKRSELYAPIKSKMQKSIDEVAVENQFDYIMDVSFGNIVYARNEEDNILPLVKIKLGL